MAQLVQLIDLLSRFKQLSIFRFQDGFFQQQKCQEGQTKTQASDLVFFSKRLIPSGQHCKGTNMQEQSGKAGH
jgi:hypothetical protein